MEGDGGLDISLGEAADLWAGLRPHFPTLERAWRTPPGAPLRTRAADPPADTVEWAPPRLSLHESVADLLSHIFDYSIVPMVGLDGPHAVTAGALMEGQPLAELEARLGLDLRHRPAPAFLLVSLTGSRGTRYYPPEWEGLNRKSKIIKWLTPEGRAAMARLRLQAMRHERIEFYGDITARQARRYVQYFGEMGTHLVRSIHYGERLFQVFEANPDFLPGLRDAVARQPGQGGGGDALAYGMAHLTRAPWVTRASAILSASDGASGRQAARHQIWASDAPGETPSLLSARAMPAWSRAAALAALPAQHIIGVSFACQALYLEDHRADVWDRLMRGGLNQRFPRAQPSGWREREPFPSARLFASAGLTGDEALCRSAAPALPPFAFALDLTAGGRTVLPPGNCLALFAGTNPATGRAAELALDCSGFDPARLTIPFVDGALCVTDNDGGRFCLVESVWLGADGDRPAIAGAPAEPDAAVLADHAAQLTVYIRLARQLQGAGLPVEIGGAMRRSAAWLAEAAVRRPDLLALRWCALQAARGAPEIELDVIVSEAARSDAMSQLLASGMDLLALPAEGPALAASVRQADQRLRAFYAAQTGTLTPIELDARAGAAGQALERRFARLGETQRLPEWVAAVFVAGASLCLPPDPRSAPHALVPGDSAYPKLWNALLSLRARYVETKAVALALQGELKDAIDLVEREVIGSNEAVGDPAGDLLAVLDALPEAPLGIAASDREGLQAEIAELLGLHRSAHLLQRQHAPCAAEAAMGPQLKRLSIVLEVLQLCRGAGIALAVLESLAPAALAARIDEALMAMPELRRSA